MSRQRYGSFGLWEKFEWIASKICITVCNSEMKFITIESNCYHLITQMILGNSDEYFNHVIFIKVKTLDTLGTLGTLGTLIQLRKLHFFDLG